MNKFKISFSLFILLFITNSFAGLNGLTHHSRANCGNNESISWDALKPHLLLIYSDHIIGQSIHSKGSMDENDKTLTRRRAEVCWLEAPPGSNWVVYAQHDTFDSGTLERTVTYAEDCSMYDGWWQFEDNNSGDGDE